MMSEAHETVAAIFTDAGWQPSTKDGWKGSFTWSDGVVVGGIDPWGTMRATSNAGFGMSLEEAAAWLVEHARQRAPVVLTTEATLDPLASLPEEQQSPRTYDEATDEYFAQYPEERGHEGDGETGAAPQAGTLDEGADQGDLGFIASDFASDAGGEDAPLDVLDADFTEDPLLEFGGEVLEEHPEEAPPPQDRFYGLDDLDRRRSLRIGDVVRISRLKQAEIALLMGDDDFAAIQNAVLRDTVDGFYKGPPDIYATFVELSRHKSAINRVKAAEADKVAFLEAATRPDLEAFNPDADWP